VANDLAELAYEASLRRVDLQEQSLTEVRARTGLLIAASSLAVSFLGRPAFDARPLVPSVAALLAFALSIAASLFVLLPKRNLIFSLVGSRVFEELYEFKDELAEVHRRLTYDLDRFWDSNERVLRRTYLAFTVATWSLAVEVVLLLAIVSGTLD
jgi:hypothetical protein